MNNPPASIDGAGFEETLTSVLPNELLLHMFRFLHYDDLIMVEHVCLRWKTVVETCFATKKRLSFDFATQHNSIERLKRYGPSIQTFKLNWYRGDVNISWPSEIADRFPNLLRMELWNIHITDEGFRYLSTKCCQLRTVIFQYCNFTDEGLRSFLQALPGIKSLTIYCTHEVTTVKNFQLPRADAALVFSVCRSLEKFEMGGPYITSDTANFSRFCKECVSLRELVIEDSLLPSEMFEKIQNCFLLEKLRLAYCQNVDDSTLSRISKGCPNLRSVSLIRLPLVSDEGLKCLARCRNLTYFQTESEEMTDATLVELTKCVNLREVKFFQCPMVSDGGCAALLALCPQLELLSVEWCKGVGNRTMDSAIEAVECRQNRLLLQLNIRGTNIDADIYEKRHPLLRLNCSTKSNAKISLAITSLYSLVMNETIK